ncbi:hypothetical protein M885DRAFT_509755 [Pelagophyceae sp. CCMP2097]|nr:hypothetical protein M885DRAFT_509755 [Pelagophyceae sp. CCMP2097]
MDVEMTATEAVEISRLLRQVASLEARALGAAALGSPPRRAPRPGTAPAARRRDDGLVVPALIMARPAGGARHDQAPSPQSISPDSSDRLEPWPPALPCYPTVRLGQSARKFADKQRSARNALDSAAVVEDQVASRPPARRSPPRGRAPARVQRPLPQDEEPARADEKTRCVLWPEYAQLEDGCVLVHVERRYRKSSAANAGRSWRMLEQSERARRRLALRLSALEHLGVVRQASVEARDTGRGDYGAVHKAQLHMAGDTVVIDPLRAVHTGAPHAAGAPEARCAAFAIQVAAAANGGLFIDTLHASAPRERRDAPRERRHRPPRPHDFADGLVSWLQTVGLPPLDSYAVSQLDAYEVAALAAELRAEDRAAGAMVALLIGTAASDVGLGALANALQGVARKRAGRPTPPDHALDEYDDADLAAFGAQAYRQVKRRVVGNDSPRAGDAPPDAVSAPPIVRVALLVDAEAVDLQDVFLDTPAHSAHLGDDARVGCAQLRKGLLRLLACMPPSVAQID